MKIILDNRDTENVHIDTYNMLTGESAEEWMRYGLRDEGRKDADTVDIDYDHAGIVRGLAHASINIVSQETAHDGIVKNITFIACGSPKYYNYTSDSYTAEYDVDEAKLEEYASAHEKEIEEIMATYYENTENKRAHAALCHYLNHAITAEDYNMAMWEEEMNVYLEHMTVQSEG